MTAAAERGTTTVSEKAVRRITERAAAEALTGPGAGRGRANGATASVRGGRAEVSLGVTLPYPAPLAETVRGVQEHVTARTRQLTGLDVPVPRVDVTSLLPSKPLPATASDPAGSHGSRRRWSPCRAPVALLACATALVCGALAVDLIRVHLADRPAGGWRTGAVHWLSGHGPGDPAVVAAGALTALVGVWMVVAALTPGHRRRCTVQAPGPGIGAAVDRSAVARLVRDAVAGVNGVTDVRVRMRGRSVSVRAGLAFGDRTDTRAAVTTAARAALTACRLRRPPRLRVTLAPTPTWRPTDPATTTTAPETMAQTPASAPAWDSTPALAATPASASGLASASAETADPAADPPRPAAPTSAPAPAGRGAVSDPAPGGDR